MKIQATSSYSYTNYSGDYVSLTTDIDLNNQEWRPISWFSVSESTSWWKESWMRTHSFHGTFLGNGHTITNVVFPKISSSFQPYTGVALFGYLWLGDDDKVTIKDLNLDITLNAGNIAQVQAGLFSRVIHSAKYGSDFLTIDNVNINYIFTDSVGLGFYNEYDSDIYPKFGGIVGHCQGIGTSVALIDDTIVKNSCVTYSGKIIFSNGIQNSSIDIGGIAGQFGGTITDCIVSGFDVEFSTSNQKSTSIYLGGLIGYAWHNILEGNYVSANFLVQMSNLSSIYGSASVGGLVGYGNNSHTTTMFNYVDISLKTQLLRRVNAGGLYGIISLDNYKNISNNLIQGNIDYKSNGNSSSYNNMIGGVVNSSSSTTSNLALEYWTTGTTNTSGKEVGFYNNINNASVQDLESSGTYNYVGGLIGGKYGPAKGNNVYNSSIYSVSGSTYKNYTYGATTDENMKLNSTYADWKDFDEHWVIYSNINNGYPMLKKFIPIAQVTGFDGSGTEGDPYLIKTYQDLLGVASYYNENYATQENVYWRLANNIDVSVDANGLPIHFTPICYNKEFDGYFDGNGKTISGLLIDNQYSYTGLFGTISANNYVKDLTVRGNIYWDQAYAVGGVAGRVMTGGYIQNCIFNGNIIGVLNTKTSTECHGVVGNYDIGGAIDCSATYKDIKYAKIGGTADSPTYTYYLYDWAQITTNLYNTKVS